MRVKTIELSNIFVAKATLQMANEMPLHICRHLRTLLYQLLHVVFTKVSWADLLSDFEEVKGDV